jgi:hypothetical protein
LVAVGNGRDGLNEAGYNQTSLAYLHKAEIRTGELFSSIIVEQTVVFLDGTNVGLVFLQGSDSGDYGRAAGQCGNTRDVVLHGGPADGTFIKKRFLA